MSIMGCYQDERAVENELGGKWELLYSQTFKEESTEGFEFPTDLDGTPWNLNGFAIILEKPVTETSSGISAQLTLNNVTSTYGMSSTTTFKTRQTFFEKHNGKWFHKLFTSAQSLHLESARSSIVGYNFVDNLDFSTILYNGTFGADCTVSFYVLRGV